VGAARVAEETVARQAAVVVVTREKETMEA